jgi:hypothetical protein
MYRGSQDSLAETIERLEAELAEMRGLSRAPRWRMRALVVLTCASVLSSVLLAMACMASHARTQALERHMVDAARVFETRSQDLDTCVFLAQRQEREITQCKVEWNQMSAQLDAKPASLADGDRAPPGPSR